MGTIVKVNHITKGYRQGAELVNALTDINLLIEEGEFVSITGPSGSGKSTLLHIIGGVDTPDQGQVLIDGMDITKMADKDLSRFRRRNLGFVFQAFNLVPVLTVKENILLPVKLDKKRIDYSYINDIIGLLGLTDRSDYYPNQLSGGQQQRVAIVRALANKPKVVLADEPTGNLDGKNSGNVLDLFKKLNQVYHQTLVMITHDNSIAKRSDRIITITDGMIG